eukprot:m.273079 g.273079  ORF g.273079 m.273079 type:complete len:314 (-) comp19752_c0_seq2:829-1770(-)
MEGAAATTALTGITGAYSSWQETELDSHRCRAPSATVLTSSTERKTPVQYISTIPSTIGLFNCPESAHTLDIALSAPYAGGQAVSDFNSCEVGDDLSWIDHMTPVSIDAGNSVGTTAMDLELESGFSHTQTANDDLLKSFLDVPSDASAAESVGTPKGLKALIIDEILEDIVPRTASLPPSPMCEVPTVDTFVIGDILDGMRSPASSIGDSSVVPVIDSACADPVRVTKRRRKQQKVPEDKRNAAYLKYRENNTKTAREYRAKKRIQKDANKKHLAAITTRNGTLRSKVLDLEARLQALKDRHVALVTESVIL